MFSTSFSFQASISQKNPKTKLVSRSQGLYHSYSFQMHFIYALLLAEGTEDSRLHLYKDTDVPPLPITYHLRSQCLDNQQLRGGGSCFYSRDSSKNLNNREHTPEQLLFQSDQTCSTTCFLQPHHRVCVCICMRVYVCACTRTLQFKQKYMQCSHDLIRDNIQKQTIIIKCNGYVILSHGANHYSLHSAASPCIYFMLSFAGGNMLQFKKSRGRKHLEMLSYAK